MLHIALDHLEIGLLIAGVEAEPEAEAVGQRYRFLDRLAGVNGGRAFIFDHVARHHVAAVRGGVENRVRRPAFDAAFEDGLERFVGGVVRFERKIVAKKDGAARALAQFRQQLRQRGYVLAVNFDEHQAARLAPVYRRVHGLDERAFAHAAGAPQQGIVGRQPGGEAQGIFEQNVAHPLDAFQQLQLDAVDTRNRLKKFALRMPYEAVGGIQRNGGRLGRRQALERFRHAA